MMEVLRTLMRVFIAPEEMDRVVAFYEEIFGQRARMRFAFPATRLELAEVGGVLLMAGDEQALKPYAATRATLVVDSLEDFRAAFADTGVTVLEEPVATPAGARMWVRHQDGMVVEYVQHTRQTHGCHGAGVAPHRPPRLAGIRTEDVERTAAKPDRVPTRISPVPEDSCDVC
ncbi:MAG: VOC family protein [Dehalococcoidia bacterium]